MYLQFSSYHLDKCPIICHSVLKPPQFNMQQLKKTILIILFFFLFSFTAKSLPLHCVVESVPSLQASFQVDARSPWRRRPNIEMDSYIIIPATTPFCDIVTIALQRLGYSSDISNTAKGEFVMLIIAGYCCSYFIFILSLKQMAAQSDNPAIYKSILRLNQINSITYKLHHIYV